MQPSVRMPRYGHEKGPRAMFKPSRPCRNVNAPCACIAWPQMASRTHRLAGNSRGRLHWNRLRYVAASSGYLSHLQDVSTSMCSIKV
jgi:hypothetical protein